MSVPVPVLVQRKFLSATGREAEADVLCRDDGQVVALKAQHKNECKGLIVQIKYLKAKWTRESTLRSDLGYQKQYLLILLARCERQ